MQKLDHVGLVVKNLDEALKTYETMLGLTPWSKNIVQSPSGYRIVILPIKGGGRLELIEPDLTKESRFSRFLKDRGEGIATISIFIENFDLEVNSLREKGFNVEVTTNSNLFPKYPFKIAWVPPKDGHGVWVELVDSEALPPNESEL